MQTIDEIVKPLRQIVEHNEFGCFYIDQTNEAPIVTIRNDGTVEVNPKYELDDAARAFWDAVRNMTPHRPTPSATCVCEECGLPLEWCSDKAMLHNAEVMNERLRSDLDKVRRETWEEAARVAEKHGDTWTGTRDVMCAAQEAAVDEKCLEIAAALRARATAKGGQTE